MDAGEDCNYWPLLTAYKWTDKMFNCNGSITGFVMCNKGNGHTDVGISLWRGGNVYRTTVVNVYWPHERDFSDSDYLSFISGDQLMVVVIYYESSIRYVYYTHVYRCMQYVVTNASCTIEPIHTV